MRIAGANVVVTGAGSGIGRALAQAFAAAGARLVTIADLDAEKARAVADALGAKWARTDVGDPDSLARLVAQARADGGDIDLFASNAGITVRGGAEAPRAAWDRIWAVNVMAHVEAARLLLPGMLERRSGYFLNTASAAGLLSQFEAPYAVTKHAAVAFAEWLSITYGDFGVGVSCLCPGAVDTPLFRMESADRQSAMGAGLLAPEEVARIALEAVEDNRFLILPHEGIAEQMRKRATDPERWLRGMRRFHAQFAPPPGAP